MKGVEEIFIDNKSKIGILMLHGFTSTPRQFKELSFYLSEKGFNILAPLIAGHGTSPKDLMKTSPKDWTESAKKAYFRLKKVSEKVFIIGNSFGSNLGFWLVKELNNEPEGIIALGAPIFLRYHNFIKLRLFTYGRFKRYYHKPLRLYKADYTDMLDEISYPIIPVKSLNEFIDFLENETMPNLNKIKIPILIANTNSDPIINPKSAEYILKNINSIKKESFWFNSREHDMPEKGCEGLFNKIYKFIKNSINTSGFNIS